MAVLVFDYGRSYTLAIAQLHRSVDRAEDEGAISLGFTTSKNPSPL
jgi:hypothetical protein